MPDQIVTEGAPVLREIAKEVPKSMFGTDELRDIVARMSAAVRATTNGVAIAAPQIGVSYRIFVARGFTLAGKKRADLPKEEMDAYPDVAFINPKIIKRSRKKELIDGEGCLSVPHVYGTVKRAVQATVRAYDEQGKKFERGGAGLLAEIFEHEVDHLNGILFIDHAKDLHRYNPEEEKSKE